jgi:hypothetical protein
MLIYLPNNLVHGLSNCGTRNTTSTPTVFYWYATLVKRNLKKKINAKK